MKLGKIAKIQSGGTPSRSNDSYYGGNIPWVKISDITDCDGILNDTEEKITELGLQSIRNIIFPKGTLLFAMYGSVGKTAIAGTLLATNQAILGIVPDNKIVLTKYLKYWFDSNKERLLSMANGVALKNLSAGIVKNLDVALPSIEKQEKIVEILDQADELRKKREETIEKLEVLKQSIYIELFGDPLINRKRFSIYKLKDVVADKGLVDGPFGSSINIERDYTSEGVIPIIRTKNVNNFKFSAKDLKFVSESKYEQIKRSTILPGDIILTKVGTIGNVCIFPSTYKRAVLSTTGSARIRLNLEMLTRSYFMYFLFFYKKQMNKIAAEGVQPFLSLRHIKNFDVPVPDLEIQNIFESEVEKIDMLIVKVKSFKQKKLFESLTIRAFNGELVK